MSNVLLIALNVLLVGGVLAFVGTLFVRLLRAALGEPETTKSDDPRPNPKHR